MTLRTVHHKKSQKNHNFVDDPFGTIVGPQSKIGHCIQWNPMKSPLIDDADTEYRTGTHCICTTTPELFGRDDELEMTRGQQGSMMKACVLGMFDAFFRTHSMHDQRARFSYGSFFLLKQMKK
jgi:hypothetical protein